MAKILMEISWKGVEIVSDYKRKYISIKNKSPQEILKLIQQTFFDC